MHPLPEAAVHEYDTTCACSFASGWRKNVKKGKVIEMKLEDYLEELFEELYQKARKAFKNDIRYAYTNSSIEEIGFEWKKRYSQQEQEYLEECLTEYRS